MREPKPNKCRYCGSHPVFRGFRFYYWQLECRRNGCRARGPERKTKMGALESWNKHNPALPKP
jgi:hypothetical protein